MYTLLFAPPALLFVLALWGLVINLRGFVLDLKETVFPARRLFLCVLFLALAGAGLLGMVYIVNLIMYRDAHPTPIPRDTPLPCC
jgi:hypothetical protein